MFERKELLRIETRSYNIKEKYVVVYSQNENIYKGQNDSVIDK